MSRAYRARVEISGFAAERAIDIEMALDDLWTFEWDVDRKRLSISGTGDGSLGGGETEEAFADRIAVAAWKANGGYCAVRVLMSYLDNPDQHARNAADFERLGGVELLANDNEAA